MLEVVLEVVLEIVFEVVLEGVLVGRFLLFDFLLPLVVLVVVFIDGASAATVDADDGEGGSSSDPELDGVRTGRAG